MFFHALQLAILIILKLVFYLWYSALLPIRAVNNSVMNAKIRAMPSLSNMQQLKVLTLSSHWFSGWDREHGPVVVPSKGCRYRLNGCLQPIGTWIIQDAKKFFFNAPLTFILRMVRWLCCCLFCLLKLPIQWLHIRETKSLCNYRTYKTTNRWRSVDTHSQNGVVTLLPSLLPTKPANISVMHRSDQITV